MAKLSLERLKTLLTYDPLTGAFIRKVRCGRYRAGCRAGTLQSEGYDSITIDYEHHLSHRLAWFCMTGEWPPEIDHENGARADNR